MRILTLLVMSLLTSFCYAQSITNVVGSQQGDQVTVRYDLIAYGSDRYFVKLLYSLDGGQSFGPELRYVTGDVGDGVISGSNKLITWDAGREVNAIDGEVVFKVEAEARKTANLTSSIASGHLGTLEVTSSHWEGNDLILNFVFTPNASADAKDYDVHEIPLITGNNGQQYEPVSGNFGSKSLSKSRKFFDVICTNNTPVNGLLRYQPGSRFSSISSFAMEIESGKRYMYVINNIPVQ